MCVGGGGQVKNSMYVCTSDEHVSFVSVGVFMWVHVCVVEETGVFGGK